ncbi:carboxylesterase/lipase family protein [Streptomyces sp. NPDC096310]|uniref:carboxylesterase/lipase family protein n=1 Tax=Streptomyces sp. NPDC096310 TaxID=3366082 RepID=UPI00381C10EF
MQHVYDIASTDCGDVRGVRQQSGIVFRGIPFAAPPVGSRRFRPPAPPQPWTGVRDCSEDSPACPQPELPAPEVVDKVVRLTTPQNEDCLYLNVWTPNCDDARRPVMVWIHGGGFATGSGSNWPYQSDSFSRDGVVLITINYRLHAFGFLYLDGLFDHAEGTGQVGILDQVAALQWVRDNVAAFGGDPDNVTVFGESAGASSVSTLMAMPAAKGLFRRAIVMSPVGECTKTPDSARQVTEAFLGAVGVRPGDWNGLQNVPAAAIIAAVSQPLAWPRQPADRLMLDFFAVRDGTVLPTTPYEAVASGSAGTVELLVGTTADEWRFAHFGVPDDASYPRPDLPALSRLFADSSSDELLRIYREALPDSTPTDIDAAVDTDFTFGIPAIRLAEGQLQHQSNVWMYRMDWPTPVSNGKYGAFHGLDVPLVFDALDAPEMLGETPPVQLAKDMHQAWIRFATNGDPNGEGLPDWPRYNLEQRPVMIFDEHSQVHEDPRAERRRFWRNWPLKETHS